MGASVIADSISLLELEPAVLLVLGTAIFLVDRSNSCVTSIASSPLSTDLWCVVSEGFTMSSTLSSNHIESFRSLARAISQDFSISFISGSTSPSISIFS